VRGPAWLGIAGGAAAAGVATALAPPLALALAAVVLAPVLVVTALRRPRLLLVAVVGAIVAYLPDALASGTPVPGIQAAIAAPVAVLAVRALLGERGLALPRVTPLLVALLLAMTCSALLSEDRGVALEAIERTAQSIVLALVMLVLLDRLEWLRRALWGVAAGAAGLAALALAQQATRAYETDFRGLSRVVEDRGIQRAAGPLDPNYFAMLLGGAAVLALYLLLAARSGRARLAAAGLLATLLAGAAVTYSRGGALALLVGVAAILVLRRVRPWVPLVVLAVAATAAPLVLPGEVKTRFGFLLPSGAETVSAAPRDESLANRYAENVVALRMFRDQPLLGVGPGNYSPRYVPYALALGFDTGYAGGATAAESQEAHNLYLETLAELGAPGALLLFAVFAVALRAAWRARARAAGEARLLAEGTLVALLVVLTASLFLHNAYPRYLWIFLALALAAGRVAMPRAPRRGPLSPAGRPAPTSASGWR
jgi:O-antigen ligase